MTGGALRVAFAGTPDFARTSLEAIVAAGFEVALVLTQPDRPAGRGLKARPSAVKALAIAHAFPVAQPLGLRLDGRHAADARGAKAELEAIAPDVVVVAAYGLILPPWLVRLPPHGCINVHASLLPRWRGAAPIQRAIEAGDSRTGISIMQMDEGLDTGDVIDEAAVAIEPSDTAATLQARLAALGGARIVDALGRLRTGPLGARSQPSDGVTYAAKIDKAEAVIDWNDDAAAIERRLRAFDPFPGARSTLDGESITCWRGALRDRPPSAPPGAIVDVDAQGVVVACGSGALALTELQRAGGRRMPAAAFLRGGRAIGAGQRFDAKR